MQLNVRQLDIPIAHLQVSMYVLVDNEETKYWLQINGVNRIKIDKFTFFEIIDELKWEPIKEQRRGLTQVITYFKPKK